MNASNAALIASPRGGCSRTNARVRSLTVSNLATPSPPQGIRAKGHHPVQHRAGGVMNIGFHEPICALSATCLANCARAPRDLLQHSTAPDHHRQPDLCYHCTRGPHPSISMFCACKEACHDPFAKRPKTPSAGLKCRGAARCASPARGVDQGGCGLADQVRPPLGRQRPSSRSGIPRPDYGGGLSLANAGKRRTPGKPPLHPLPTLALPLRQVRQPEAVSVLEGAGKRAPLSGLPAACVPVNSSLGQRKTNRLAPRYARKHEPERWRATAEVLGSIESVVAGGRTGGGFGQRASDASTPEDFPPGSLCEYRHKPL